MGDAQARTFSEIIVADFPLAAAAGWLGSTSAHPINDTFTVNKFGRNPDIDTSAAAEGIWGGGSTFSPFTATAAEQVEVFSSDPVDDIAGTGARTIQIYGLDGDYNPVDETIDLDGTTGVFTTQTFLRVYRAIVRSAGVGGVNAGTLTIRQKDTTANVFEIIQIAYAQTMLAAYTIPLGFDAYMLSWYGNISGANNADVTLRLRARPLGEVVAVKEEMGLKATGTSAMTREYAVPKGPFEEKTDLYVEGKSDAVNTEVVSGFDLVLVSRNL